MTRAYPGTSADALRQLAITYNQLAIELYAAKDYAQVPCYARATRGPVLTLCTRR